MLARDLFQDVLNELRILSRFGYFLWSSHVLVSHGFKKIPVLEKLWRIHTIIAFIMDTTSWIITLILFVVATILLIPFVFCKIFTVIYLRVRHKSNYGGVFQSADILWVVEDKTAYNIINLLILLKFNNLEENLQHFVEDLCKNRLFKAKRMTSVRRFFMGYGYFLCNQLSPKDVISSIRISRNGICRKSDLRKFVEKFANKELPKGNSAACQIIICEDPVDLENEEDGEQYAILLRVHHSVADGITLMSMLERNISDEQNRNKRNFDRRKSNFNNSRSHLPLLLERKDKNDLKTNKLSGEKKIAFKVEKKNGLLQKVKRIKDVIPNCVFTSILLTAISASLQDFFKKNFEKIPKNLVLTFMAIADRNELHFEHDELGNIFSMGSIKLPINIEWNHNSADIIGTLQEVMNEYQRFNDSSDLWVLHWQMKTVSNFLPRPLVKLVINLNDVTSVTFSNLPGIKKMHILGHPVNHMMFWVPNYVTIGVGFSLLTYDDRFQMGLLVDEYLISNEDEVQEILDGVFTNINRLYDAVSTRFSNGNILQ